MVVVDKLAPDFEGTAYVGGDVKQVRLSDYRGKWVLVCFYPGDFTYVCATEVAGIISNYANLKQFGGVGIAISADSIHSHKVWAETSPAITSALKETGRKFPPMPMVADPTFEIGRKYGVVDEENGIETRGRFIVDPDGILRGYEVLNATVGRNLEETFRQLQAFKFVRDTGKVTPAGWKPGQEGIEPSIENAGKI
ncbi:MAG: peroxiredoxin [Methanosarcinaceae archaeon]|nr:peroxiredoxin [Methanosarcinaceae archaeon]